MQRRALVETRDFVAIVEKSVKDTERILRKALFGIPYTEVTSFLSWMGGQQNDL